MNSVESLLKNNKIVLLEDLKGVQKHHSMKCLICEHEWSATITSKLQGFKLRKTKGCPNCSRKNNRNTHEEFLIKLENRNVRNPNSLVFLSPSSQEYFNNNTKLLFTCINNHEWSAIPTNVVDSERGCPVCKLEKDSNHKRTPIDKIKEQIITTYGKGKFDLTNIRYTNIHSTMTVRCYKHGDVSMKASLFLNRKQGCKQCNRENFEHKRLDNFIDKSNKIHDFKYNYDKVHYENEDKNGVFLVSIDCPIHGKFEQRVGDHVHGRGCKKCVQVGFSRKQITWLEHIIKTTNIKIQHALNGGEYCIPDTKYSVDGYCEETNTIYEFHGDAFHGNLNRYAADKQCHPFNDLTAKQLFDNTKRREKELECMGYNLCTMWESDFDNLKIPLLNIQSNVRRRSVALDVTLLETLQLTLEDKEFIGYKYQHNFKCGKCHDIFKTTLTQRKQSYRKYGVTGCPKCNNVSVKNRTSC
jgi:hypothetical protein